MCEYKHIWYSCRRYLTTHGYWGALPVGDRCENYPRCRRVYSNPPVFLGRVCEACWRMGVRLGAASLERGEVEEEDN